MVVMTPASAAYWQPGPAVKIAGVIDFFGIADMADQLAARTREITRPNGFQSSRIAWNWRARCRR